MESNNRVKDFSKNVEPISFSRTPTDFRSYSRYGFRMNTKVHSDFSLEQINELIRNGAPEQLRELSRYYYRVSGIYRNVIDLSANISKYDTIVVPLMDTQKSIPKSQLLKDYYKVCAFVESLHVPQNFSRISRLIYINGIYYGLLRDEDGLTIQDLPMEFCRSRFKDGNDIDILEFNLRYFSNITDDALRIEAISSYPVGVQKAWNRYVKQKGGKINRSMDDYWIEIPPEDGGIVFTYGDRTPPFIAAIPDLYNLDDAIDREAERDENELYKLLIQKMPITSRGELVFQLDEVQDIHAGTAQMLSNTSTVDVLTTFGDVQLESVQDSTTANQSSSRIEKYVDSAYNALGISQLLFNNTVSSGMDYAVKKHEALIKEITNLYSVWIKFQINERFGGSKFTYNFEILPTTIFNQKECQEKYFQGAQYGYSKMYAGISLGIKQLDIVNLSVFENDYLDLFEIMKPLASSYTSGGESSSKQNTSSEGLMRKATATQSKTDSTPQENDDNSEKTDEQNT